VGLNSSELGYNEVSSSLVELGSYEAKFSWPMLG